jgi:hypothetical protein
MWIMTPFGILMPAVRPADTIEPGDEMTMQVRSRRKKDLEILRDKYMGDKLGPIMHTPKFDYNYRAYCRPADFAAATSQMVLDVDYLKFKPTTESKYGDKSLHDVYNSIWGTVCRLGTPYEGLYGKGTYGSKKYKGRYGGSYTWTESLDEVGRQVGSTRRGKYIKTTAQDGSEKWIWHSYVEGDRDEYVDDEYDIDYVPGGESDEVDVDAEISALVDEYPSLADAIRGLAADLDSGTIKDLHDELIDKAKEDALADMAEVGLDWHYDESADEWSPEAVNDKANHRTKKGKKKAARKMEPEFLGPQ